MADLSGWDESTRPTAPVASPEDPLRALSPQQSAVGRHLIDVHDALRAELDQVADLVAQVRSGLIGAGAARGAVNAMTLRQNSWTLGAYCAAYCRVVSSHHSLEDEAIFPHLLAADPRLGGVLNRLQQEHLVIHSALERLDAALVLHLGAPHDFGPLDQAAAWLTRTLLSHLAYEEEQLVEPLGRHGFYTGQV